MRNDKNTFTMHFVGAAYGDIAYTTNYDYVGDMFFPDRSDGLQVESRVIIKQKREGNKRITRMKVIAFCLVTIRSPVYPSSNPKKIIVQEQSFRRADCIGFSCSIC